ncbi:MAG: hypothetical protein ACI4Q4_03555 [Oscillospiraceae bacterium]
MTETTRDFINADEEKLDMLIKENPIHISVARIAEFLQIDVVSARAAIECGSFGLSWRKQGKMNKAYCIPTAQFVRWYLIMKN